MTKYFDDEYCGKVVRSLQYEGFPKIKIELDAKALFYAQGGEKYARYYVIDKYFYKIHQYYPKGWCWDKLHIENR